eukprot:scaffold14629_cov72-Cyclotella_meneghiniana.AAC.7
MRGVVMGDEGVMKDVILAEVGVRVIVVGRESLCGLRSSSCYWTIGLLLDFFPKKEALSLHRTIKSLNKG